MTALVYGVTHGRCSATTEGCSHTAHLLHVMGCCGVLAAACIQPHFSLCLRSSKQNDLPPEVASNATAAAAGSTCAATATTLLASGSCSPEGPNFAPTSPRTSLFLPHPMCSALLGQPSCRLA